MRVAGITLIATALAATPALGQVRADPGVVIGDRVAVRVNVTLADDETPYYPVRGLALQFTRPASDTVIGRTDEAGVLTVLLAPGEYRMTSARPFAWKGSWYTWSMPVVVRADMRAIELGRGNARVDRTAARAGDGRQPAPSAGNATPPAGGAPAARSGQRTTIAWLSMEAGGEGGLTRFGDGTGSDAGYGGAGAFVGGLGPVAIALGYRYTRIRYGGGLDPGNMRGVTAELRYHLRPGAAPVRPYLGAVASAGSWQGPDAVGEPTSDMRMFGGTVGAQFGLATSVRLHFSVTAAGTNIKTSPESNGLFASANLGLTFDIFSPAR